MTTSNTGSNSGDVAASPDRDPHTETAQRTAQTPARSAAADHDPRAEHRRLYPRVTSFRSRRAALTPFQQRAWDDMWPIIGRDVPAARPLPHRADPDEHGFPAPSAAAEFETPSAAAEFETPSNPLARAEWFGRSAPLIVEIGCGTGTSTVAMAAAEPQRDVLAVEVYVPGIAQLLAGVQRQSLTNVRVVRGDGVAVLEDMIAADSLEGVRVYFPDPWPKARHHKRRLLQPRMFALIADRLRPGGILHVATDHADYAEAIGYVGDAEPRLTRLTVPRTRPMPTCRSASIGR